MAIAFFQTERRKRRRVVETPVGEGLLAERPKTSSPIAGLELFLGGALPERRFRLDAFIGNGRTGVRAGTVSKSQWET